MKKDKKSTINIADLIAPLVSSRDTLSILRQEVEKTATEAVDFDFQNVEFISRSAAHEFLLLKEELHQKNIQINFIHTNSDVTEMLRIVAANRAVPKAKPEFHPKRTTLNSLLKEVGV